MIVEFLKTQLEYFPETGELRWKVAAKNRPIGMNVGQRRAFLIERISYVRAKVCWALYYGEYPKETIDHKDTNFKNDRIVNLRKAVGSQNQYNKVTANPNGHKGVTWRMRLKKPWLSKIRVNGRRIN